MPAQIIRLRRRRSPPRRQPRPSFPSFVVDRKNAGLPLPAGKKSRRCFWHVSPTGNYLADIETGNWLAVEYLDHDQGGRPPLQWIVGDMPRELSGIEIGFLRLIGLAAVASGGMWRAINEHASRVMAALGFTGGGPETPVL